MERLISALRTLRPQRLFRVPTPPPAPSHGPGEGASSPYLQALDYVGDAVVITNQAGVIQYVNPACETLCGFRRDEVVGQSPSLLKSGVHQASFYSRLWDTLKQGKSFRANFINRHKDGSLFTHEQTISPITVGNGRIAHYVSAGRKVNEQIALEQRLHQLEYYDALTGLPNRKLFLSKLASHMERSGAGQSGPLLLLLLEINNLEKINDTLGYGAGDDVLRQIAGRLAACSKSVGDIARLGGDEFAMILPNCDDSRSASIAAQMLKLMGRPLTLGDRDVTVSACIGIAQYPRDATNPETLVSHADLALHRAKADGLNCFHCYQSMMRDCSQEDLQLDTALHGALERNELHLVFQPVVRSADGSVVGLEALLRWQSPTLGAVPPARFIPQLERNGLIIPVGRWVLATACGEVAALTPGQGTALRLAVNVSARQLLHPDFVTDVKTVLEDTGLDAGRLELEITESVLIENAVVAADVLRALCRLGVTIAADDFGTGYSSLSYLWKFPFSTLKIDRSFVSALITDNQAKTIVSSILGLAGGLGLSVVAEGIETPVQFEVLKTLGCPLIQGYWTGRPMPMAAIKEGMIAATDTEVVRQNSEERSAWMQR